MQQLDGNNGLGHPESLVDSFFLEAFLQATCSLFRFSADFSLISCCTIARRLRYITQYGLRGLPKQLDLLTVDLLPRFGKEE